MNMFSVSGIYNNYWKPILKIVLDIRVTSNTGTGSHYHSPPVEEIRYKETGKNKKGIYTLFACVDYMVATTKFTAYFLILSLGEWYHNRKSVFLFFGAALRNY